jgi:hypothetical protein
MIFVNYAQKRVYEQLKLRFRYYYLSFILIF